MFPVHYDKSCHEDDGTDKQKQQAGLGKMGSFMDNYFKPQAKQPEENKEASDIDSDREIDSDRGADSDVE